jgi:hypothetical protein
MMEHAYISRNWINGNVINNIKSHLERVKNWQISNFYENGPSKI